MYGWYVYVRCVCVLSEGVCLVHTLRPDHQPTQALWLSYEGKRQNNVISEALNT